MHSAPSAVACSGRRTLSPCEQAERPVAEMRETEARNSGRQRTSDTEHRRARGRVVVCDAEEELAAANRKEQTAPTERQRRRGTAGLAD